MSFHLVVLAVHPDGWAIDNYTTIKKGLIDNPAHDRRVVVWILKKRVTSKNEITDGFKTAYMLKNR